MLNRLLLILAVLAAPLMPALAQDPVRAVLEEESPAGDHTRFDGLVLWRSAVAGDTGRPFAEAQIEIPGRELGVTLTFRVNGDPALPASHVIEIVTEVPASFPGGAIAEIPALGLKQTPADSGTGLVATAEKLTDGLVWLALSDQPEAEALNRRLLEGGELIDLPLLYGNGQRALITFAKGDAGRAAIAAMLAAD